LITSLLNINFIPKKYLTEGGSPFPLLGPAKGDQMVLLVADLVIEFFSKYLPNNFEKKDNQEKEIPLDEIKRSYGDNFSFKIWNGTQNDENII